ncbi:MAG: T9SS type A sorting domain-containing protein [Bacteroidetes bacterium]|nr:T9SS type A sorting domain-containing protein [Bacteroidota bacterium]
MGKWNSNYRTEYVYDIYRRTPVVKTYKWVKGGWEPSSIDSNFYDGKGKLIRTVKADYNGKAYVNSTQHSYSFDTKSRLTFDEVKTFTAGKWETISRYAYVYNAKGQLTDIKEQLYSLGSFNDASRIMFEYDATFTDIEETSILSSELQLFPNPFSELVNISLPKNASNQGFIISIFDLSGKLIISKPANTDNNQFDLSGLNSGIYLLRCSNGLEDYRKTIIKR